MLFILQIKTGNTNLLPCFLLLLLLYGLIDTVMNHYKDQTSENVRFYIKGNDRSSEQCAVDTLVEEDRKVMLSKRGGTVTKSKI